MIKQITFKDGYLRIIGMKDEALALIECGLADVPYELGRLGIDPNAEVEVL